MTRAELHFHLLPEVDDGPADLDDAVGLARLAVADGTGLVTVTPHVRDLLALGILGEVPARVREVQAALDAAGVPLEVRTGRRARPRRRARLRRADARRDRPGPARRALGADRGAAVRRAGGRVPRRDGLGPRAGLRHADRPPGALRAADGAAGAIAAERRAGARLQVNASSLTGAHGEAARAAGLALMRAGHADVIASDAHRGDAAAAVGRGARGARRARDPRRRGAGARRPARAARARSRRAARRARGLARPIAPRHPRAPRVARS